jgi:hypothetical protein
MNFPAVSSGVSVVIIKNRHKRRLTQAPQPPSPSPEGEGERLMKKVKYLNLDDFSRFNNYFWSDYFITTIFRVLVKLLFIKSEYWYTPAGRVEVLKLTFCVPSFKSVSGISCSNRPQQS